MPLYQYSSLHIDVSQQVSGEIASSSISNRWRSILNRAVRAVISFIDLRSTKRYAKLTFDTNYSYDCPADLKDNKVIDIIEPDEEDEAENDWNYVTPEEFDRQKADATEIFTVLDKGDTRMIRVASTTSVTVAASSLYFYSKYGWQDSSGNWKENAQTINDLLNADTEEYDLIVEKGIELAERQLRTDWNAVKEAKGRFNELAAQYKSNYPSEAKPLTQTRYDINEY